MHTLFIFVILFLFLGLMSASGKTQAAIGATIVIGVAFFAGLAAAWLLFFIVLQSPGQALWLALLTVLAVAWWARRIFQEPAHN